MTQYKVDAGQIKIIHTLLARIGMANDKDYKMGLVQEYSNKRETSTKELMREEAKALIEDLQGMVGWTAEEIQANQKRRKIFGIAHEMNWELEDHKVDKVRVDAWCINYGFMHKPLAEYSNNELSKLVWQFLQVKKDYINAL